MIDDDILDTAMKTLEAARKEYVETKGVVEVFYIISKTDVTAVIPWGISKDMAAEVLRHQCKERKARGIFHVFEAWAVLGEAIPPDTLPSQHPKGKEYIIGVLQDVRLGIRIWTSRICSGYLRTADPVTELQGANGELCDMMGGRYSDILCADELAS